MDAFFAEKNPRRARRRLAQGVGAIQSPGLEPSNHPPEPSGQGHGSYPNFQQSFDMFLTFVEVVWDHLGCVWGLVRGH